MSGFPTTFGPVTWLEVVGDGGEWFGGALAIAAYLGHDGNVVGGWMEARGQRPLMETEAGFVLSIEISIYFQSTYFMVNCSGELTKFK